MFDVSLVVTVRGNSYSHGSQYSEHVVYGADCRWFYFEVGDKWTLIVSVHCSFMFTLYKTIIKYIIRTIYVLDTTIN